MSRAGQLPAQSDLIDVKEILKAYYEILPDINNPDQKVTFGTSGHRGKSSVGSFNEAHIIAIVASLVEYRKSRGIFGPIFIGFDTHLLSIPAFRTTLQVLIAAGIRCSIDSHITEEILDLAEKGKVPKNSSIWTPTPAISRAILRYNQKVDTENFVKLQNGEETDSEKFADGIVITPSHNPPTDGGFKYNSENGGPADSEATKIIENRANEILKSGEWRNIAIAEFSTALEKSQKIDFRAEYIEDLKNAIDMDVVAKSDIRIGIDSMGGASIDYWSEIAKVYNLNLTVINDQVDPQFPFVTLDWDEKIRMDCSSKDAMNGAVLFANSNADFDILAGNDGDADRHGIVSRTSENDKFILMNPNHFLAVAIYYLWQNRPDWFKNGRVPKIGKTLVSSSLIDRVVSDLNASLFEVPVGFKWLVDGLLSGDLGFGGEESAGASFLNKDGRAWTTDKDGIIMTLLAAEIMAKTSKSPAKIYQELTGKFGESWYERIDAPADSEQKQRLTNLRAKDVDAEELAGEKILHKEITASGNGVTIGGLKVVTENAWFAARPSGTENVYKIYAESFISREHLREVQIVAKKVVAKAIE